MTKDQLYAYFKRTAPAEDLKFWLAHATMSPGLRACFEVLKASSESVTVTRAAFYKQFTALQAEWRRESNQRERAEIIAAGGWYDAKRERWIFPVAPESFSDATNVA